MTETQTKVPLLDLQPKFEELWDELQESIDRKFTQSRGGSVVPTFLNWRRRMWLLKNVFEGPVGHAIYRQLQRHSKFHTSPSHFANKRDQVLHVLDAARRAGTPIAGATIIEIGTGWVPLLPFIAWLLGAEKVHCMDLNRHLLPCVARRMLRWLAADASTHEQLEKRAAEPDVLADRLNRLQKAPDPMTLFDTPEMVYSAPSDARNVGLPDNTIDLVCSNVTLEHIPATALGDIFRESARLLHSNGRVVHLVDPSDHASHSDSNISPVNFLRYTDQEWEKLSGTGIAYHNRLRVPEYKTILQASEFLIDQFTSKIHPRSLQDLETFELAEPRWTNYSHEDLARQYLTIVARPGRENQA